MRLLVLSQKATQILRRESHVDFRHNNAHEWGAGGCRLCRSEIQKI